MKKILLVLLVLSSITSFAQDAASIVKWTFSSAKGSEPNKYILTASAKIDEGWHVFAPDPGGDGLLIPTEIKFTGKTVLKNVSKLIPFRRPITKEMTGVGFVNYYEGEITFTVSFEIAKPTTIAGTVSFQCCDDKMCLAPTDIPFKIKL